ncbi:MAG: hypothetical protein HY841_08585 [Bacteroidetes bacterium]|nr:hypothetical protein [Bacteroidota bacterium]
MWYFSGFFKNKHSNNLYSLSYLVFHRGNEMSGKPAFSSHVAITDIENKNYYFEIFNPVYAKKNVPDFSENLDLYIGNDSRNVHLNARKKNYLLKARSQRQNNFDIKLFCDREITDTVNNFCSDTNKYNVFHSFSFFREVEGKLNFGEAKMKVSGELFYNRIYKTKSLMLSHKEIFLFNMQIDSTGECFTVFFTNEKNNPESFNIISICSTSKKINKTDIEIKPTGFWESAKLKKNYPIKWEVKIPSANVNVNLTATSENQEIQWMKNGYWMGSYWITSAADSTKRIGKATAVCLK